jgi:hypothetical protein
MKQTDFSRRMRTALLGLLLVTILFLVSLAQAFDGNTLISPNNSNNTILVNMSGTTIKTWHGASGPAMVAYLFSDNSILRPCMTSGSFGGGGAGGRIQKIDANDDVVWDFTYSNSSHQQHHDIQPMPNGNILLICW